MSKMQNNDFEFTGDKKHYTPTPHTQEELDAIDYVLPIKKKRKRHFRKKVSTGTITDINKEAEAIDYIYARPHSKRKDRKKRIKKTIITIICVVLGLIIAGAGTVFVFNEVGKSAMHNYEDMNIEPSPDVEKVESVENSGRTICYDGKTYAFNEKVATVVLMGIDNKEDEFSTDKIIGTGGQADAIYIAVIDTLKDKVSILGVSRDTMVDVNLYNTSGDFVKTENMQLCLSYAYGNGGASSCENTIVSLERLFYGLPFNTYFSFDTNALEILTDTIGGVTLTAKTDFYSYREQRTVSAGETVTLFGEDATQYIRTRDLEAIDSNNDRMIRQKQFMTAFLSRIWDSVKSNPALVLDLYGTIDDYSTTNLTTAKMTYLASTALSSLNSYSEIEFYNVPGTVKTGEYAEFYVDQDGLMELLLDLFYIEVS